MKNHMLHAEYVTTVCVTLKFLYKAGRRCDPCGGDAARTEREVVHALGVTGTCAKV